MARSRVSPTGGIEIAVPGIGPTDGLVCDGDGEMEETT